MGSSRQASVGHLERATVGFVLWPLFVTACDRVMRHRCIAVNGSAPEIYNWNYASPALREALARCEQDRAFSLAAALFRSELHYAAVWFVLIAACAGLCVLSWTFKRRRTAVFYAAAFVTYLLLVGPTFQVWRLSTYYLVNFGD